MTSLRDIGILKGPDLIQLLNTLLEEGTLKQPGKIHTLSAQNVEKGHTSKLIFFEGYLLQGISSDYKIRLGEILVQKELINKSDLEDVLREQHKRVNTVIGQILLEKNLLHESDLLHLINHLTEIVGYEILMWHETDFKLDSAEMETKDLASHIGATVELRQLLSIKEFTQGAEKNLPVVALIKDTFTNPNLVVRRLREVDIHELSDMQYRIYQFINNKTNLREILMLSDFDYFETYTALFQLVSWGIAGMGGMDAAQQYRNRPAPPAPLQRKPVPAARPVPTSPPSAARKQMQEAIADANRQFIKKTSGSDLLHILVSILSSGKRTGKLIIENQQNEIRSEITLYRGNLVHATSTMYSDRFGDLLVKKGLVTPDQLQEALQEQKKTPGIRLGEIMLRMGLIELGTIPKMIFHQIECVLYEVLSWQEAKFFFEEQPDDLVSQTDYVIHADYEIEDGRLISKSKGENEGRHLLGDADKNLPVLLLIKEKMPHPSAVVQRTPQASEMPLSDSQKEIMVLVNGINSINDIVVLSDLDYFQTYAGLFQLYSWGAIEILPVHRALPTAEPAQAPHYSDTGAARPAPSAPVQRKPILPPPSPQADAAEEHELSKSDKVRKLLEENKREITLLKSRLRKFQKLESIFGEELLQKMHAVPVSKHPHLQQLLNSLLDFAEDSRGH